RRAGDVGHHADGLLGRHGRRADRGQRFAVRPRLVSEEPRELGDHHWTAILRTDRPARGVRKATRRLGGGCMSSAPAEYRDDAPEPVELEERREDASITFVSPESYPPDDPSLRGTFPLTYRAGEWYI